MYLRITFSGLHVSISTLHISRLYNCHVTVFKTSVVRKRDTREVSLNEVAPSIKHQPMWYGRVRQTDKQTDRQTDPQTNRRTDRQIDGQTDRQTARQTHRRTDRQTERQTDGQTDNPQHSVPRSLCLLQLCNAVQLSKVAVGTDSKLTVAVVSLLHWWFVLIALPLAPDTIQWYWYRTASVRGTVLVELR